MTSILTAGGAIASEVINRIRAARGDIIWKEFIKHHEKHEARFRIQLRKWFTAQEKEVIAKINRRPSKWVNTILVNKEKVDEWIFDEKEWNKMMKGGAIPIMSNMVEETGMDSMKTLPGMSALDFDINNERIADFIDEKAGTYSRFVNETTVTKLRTSLIRGIEAHETIPKLTKRVNGIFESATKYRSHVIARTEMTGAGNFAISEAGEQSEIVWGHEWIAATDERTRPTHLAVNGKIARNGDRFAGVNLLYPGDPSGDIAEIILCRCTQSSVLYNDARVPEDERHEIIPEMPEEGESPKDKYQNYELEMKNKYGENLYRDMSDEELDLFEKLEGDAHKSQRATQLTEVVDAQQQPTVAFTTPKGNKIPIFKNDEEYIEYFSEKQLPDDIWLHGSCYDTLNLSENFHQTSSSSGYASYLFTTKDPGVADQYAKTVKGFFAIEEKGKVKTFLTSDDKTASRVARQLINKKIVTNYENIDHHAFVKNVTRDLQINDIVDNSIYDHNDIVSEIYNIGYEAIETSKEKIFIRPWESLNIIPKPK